MGYETCTTGQQCFGGHGYVKEWGMEQYVRDVRIAQIYEGTNGIQALDLIGRKLIANKGDYLDTLLDLINTDIADYKETKYKEILISKLSELKDLSNKIIKQADSNHDTQQLIACDYLHYTALVLYAFLWLKMCQSSSNQTTSFIESKNKLMQFFYKRLLPRTLGLKVSIENELT